MRNRSESFEIEEQQDEFEETLTPAEEVESLLVEVSSEIEGAWDDIPEDSKSIISEIKRDADSYYEFKPKEWKKIVERLHTVISDYSAGLEQEADDALGQLELDAKELKKLSVH